MHSGRFPRKALEEALPAGGRIEDFADHSRLLAETVKVSVLKLDPCPVRGMQRTAAEYGRVNEAFFL